MARPKKPKPTHSSGKYVIKKTIGHNLDGSPIRKPFYSDISKTDCEKQYEEWKLQNEIARISGKVSAQKESGFTDWANKWLEVYKKPNVSENTYKFTYENTVTKHLIPYFKNCKLTDIKAINIQSFYATKKDLSESMLEKMQLCINGIFETAIDNDICYKNPAKKVTFVSNADKYIKKVYTPTEMEFVKKIGLHNMIEIFILLETGMRRGELLGLKWSDIDYKEKTIYVNCSIADNKTTRYKIMPPKWDSYRYIPVSDGVLDVLKNLPKLHEEFIFVNANGEIQSPNTWSQKLERFMDKLHRYTGVPSLTAHELRHSFGTDLRRRGVDIYTIQKILGHKDIKMTSETYVHNEIKILRKAMKLA